MTRLLNFVRPGTPGQLAVGAMITFVFLVASMLIRPFCSAGLNSLNSMSLVAQFCTLFVGINIALLDLTQAGQGSSDDTDRAVIVVMVVLVNAATLVWPLLRKVLNGLCSLLPHQVLTDTHQPAFEAFLNRTFFLCDLPLPEIHYRNPLGLLSHTHRFAHETLLRLPEVDDGPCALYKKEI